MQEVTATQTTQANSFDKLRTSTLVDTSSQAKAFSDFLGLMRSSASQSAQLVSPEIKTVQDTAQNLASDDKDSYGVVAAASPVVTAVASTVNTAATGTAAATTTAAGTTTGTAAANTAAATSATTATSRTATESGLNAARNSPVSREAFEEAKPALAKAGLTEKELAELSARVQAGTLTWGQLVQTVGTHMTGSKKAVTLSASDAAEMQTLFQKFGFAPDVAVQMVQSVAKGDGLKVLSAIQDKLSTMSDDTSLDLDKDQLATFFGAIKLPTATADKLTELLGNGGTVADMKNALAVMSQALQDQRSKTAAADTDLAKTLGKIMEKDVAKATRDASQTASKETAGSGEVAYDLKTKDKNDTSWFSEHEKNQKKSSDDSWRNFISKVREDASQAGAAAQQASQNSQTSQNGQNGQSALAKDGLEALAARTATAQAATQGKADTAAQTKTYEKVTAPKVLDQVSEAMLKDLGQGRKQLTIQLDPENLGKVQVMLQVKGKEVNATLRAEDADTAAMLQTNLAAIRKTLEDKGLTVQNVEVQTGLASRQDQQNQFNAEQHNQAQERQDLSRIMNQLRALRTDVGDVALDMQNGDMQAILADRGLHIVA